MYSSITQTRDTLPLTVTIAEPETIASADPSHTHLSPINSTGKPPIRILAAPTTMGPDVRLFSRFIGAHVVT